jgi:hypothetical protein
MRTHDSRIDKEVTCQGALLRVEALPEPAPDTAPFPAAKAVVHRVLVPKILWEVAPGDPRAGAIQDRCDKQPITERRGAASAGLQGGQDGGNLRPGLIRQQQTYGHQIPSYSKV